MTELTNSERWSDEIRKEGEGEGTSVRRGKEKIGESRREPEVVNEGK